jgi:hypothetical protein
MVRRTLNRGGYRVGNRTINKRRKNSKNSKNMRGGGDEQDQSDDGLTAAEIVVEMKKRKQELAAAQAESAQAEPAQDALFKAIRLDDGDQVRDLVAKNPGLLDVANNGGMKAVGYAVQKIVLGDLGDDLRSDATTTTVDMVKLLCELGANVNDRGNDQVDTPLHMAVMYSDLTDQAQEELVALLLRLGADPHLTNIDDETALEVSINQKVKDMLHAAMSPVSPPQPAAGAVGDSTDEFVNGKTIEFTRPYQMAKQMQEDMVNYIGRGYDFKIYWETHYPNNPDGPNLLDTLGFYDAGDMSQEKNDELTSRVEEHIVKMWKYLENKNSPIKFARDEHELEANSNYLPITLDRLKMNAAEGTGTSQDQIEALMGQMEVILTEEEGEEQDLEQIQVVKRKHNRMVKNSMREALGRALDFQGWLSEYNRDDWDRRKEPGWLVDDPYIPLWEQVVKEREEREESEELARDELSVVFNGKPSKWGLVLGAFDFDDRPTIHENIPTKYLKVSGVKMNTQAYEHNSYQELVGLVIKSVNGEKIVGRTGADLVRFINEASNTVASDLTTIVFVRANFSVNFVDGNMGIHIQAKYRDGENCGKDDPAAYLEVLDVDEAGAAYHYKVRAGQVIKAINGSEFKVGTTLTQALPMLRGRPVDVIFGPRPDI